MNMDLSVSLCAHQVLITSIPYPYFLDPSDFIVPSIKSIGLIRFSISSVEDFDIFTPLLSTKIPWVFNTLNGA